MGGLGLSLARAFWLKQLVRRCSKLNIPGDACFGIISPMILDASNSELHCSICANPVRLFAPDTCRDESDRIVHIKCYMQQLAQNKSSTTNPANQSYRAARDQRGISGSSKTFSVRSQGDRR